MAEQIVLSNNTGKITAIVSVVLVVLLAGALVIGYFAYKSIMDENTRLANEVVAFKKVTEDLVRSSSRWATKDDLDKELSDLMSKEDLKALRKDLKELGSRLTAVGKTVGEIQGRVSKLESSDQQGEEKPAVKVCKETGEPIDVHGYTKKVQIKELKDSNNAPVAQTQFDASKEKPWSYKVYGKQYRLTTVVGKKESGQLTFHHQLQYSVPSKDPNKLYSINLVSSSYSQAPESNKLFWFNPRIDANFVAGGMVYKFADGPGRPNDILSMGVDLGLSLSSYGPTKLDSWFRLFRFSLGYNIERQACLFSFSPITFNIGKPLPILTNLYITPQVSIDSAGGLTINMGIGPQF